MQDYCCKSCKNCASSSRRARRKNDEKGYPPPKYYTSFHIDSSDEIKSAVDVGIEEVFSKKNGYLSEHDLKQIQLSQNQLETVISWGKTLISIAKVDKKLSLDSNDKQVLMELEKSMKTSNKKLIDASIFD